jgi:hypothetical protein
MANDVENPPNFLHDQLGEAAAEPDECGRCTVIVLLAVLALPLIAIAVVLINVHGNSRETSSRLSVAALVVGILAAVLGSCAWAVLMFVIGQWELGNPEGSRLVDYLLSI